MIFYLQRNAEGRELFDEVCKKLLINEKEYFGLTYTGAQDVKVCLYKLFYTRFKALLSIIKAIIVYYNRDINDKYIYLLNYSILHKFIK